MQIADHVFLITGAASGLGAATARLIAGQGGRMVIADLNCEAGEGLARELGASAAFARTDVTSEADGRAAIELALSTHGHLHALVNCAGIAPAAKILSREGPHSLDAFSRTIGINLMGTFNMLRLAAEAIAKEQPGDDGERGVIVNTASVAAFDGQIGQVAYAASKGGVAALTLPAARELARQGIRVVTIAPGVFETPMVSAFPPAVQQSLAENVPFPHRLGRPEEYAALVRHIVENRMINGEVIRLDGALRMPAR
jgi:NAD(P)-dependent dehydrogenase (short-subunit alcohol dehydrogenase family)